MLDLILPDTLAIIKETMKRDRGVDCSIKLVERTDDYEIYVNIETNSRYLVQCSHKYDLFGFQNYRETFPAVDTFIYIGVRFIFIHFAEPMIKEFLEGTRARKAMRDGTPDPSQWWTPSFLLFESIGGIIYDYKDWVLVDRRI